MGDRRAAINFHNQAIEAKKEAEKSKIVDLSYQLFCSSVYADPTFANGFFECGNADMALILQEAAVACFRRALELPIGDGLGDMTPDLKGKILTNLAHTLHHSGHDPEARESVMAALAMDKNLAMAWLNKSLIHARYNEREEAIIAAREAYLLDPSSIVETGLAFAYLFDGQYALGLEHFEARFAYHLPQFDFFPYPKWRGEPDKTLFLVSEQGIGDAISMSRFIEAAAKRSKFIHVAVQPELQRLFAAMFLHLTNVVVFPLPCEFKPADYWTTFVSLPTALGLTSDEIKNTPNLELPAFTNTPIWKSPDRKFHIGCAWAGSPKNFIDKHRSFSILNFLDIYKVPGVQLYSLQIGDRVIDLHDSGCAPVIRDLSPYIRDVADSIAAIRELDLVITTESALGHICGLMGKECWVPYSWRGRDWRVGNTEKGVLWNPKHRIFMQGEDAQWSPVFERIVDAVREKVK